ncbi:hypothetical protein [Geodermatophilus chilensis]|uniref:hypothetical protein n=1 Tax=Geodermatophilus chilensis TaxID=2035835 RepID=UPI000C265B54|nr:hypothetical protein [Geodermatophilus chilensis]
MKPTPAQVEDDSRCDRCTAYAVWSIQNYEGGDMQPIVRWFACGRHLHQVLTEADWEVDAVQVMDLRGPSWELS